MWGRVFNGQLVEIIYQPKAIMINDVQHPKTIFTRAWTNEERKAIGIIPFEYSGSHGDDRFYTNSESTPVVGSDKVVITKSKSAAIKILQTQCTLHTSFLTYHILIMLRDWVE